MGITPTAFVVELVPKKLQETTENVVSFQELKIQRSDDDSEVVLHYLDDTTAQTK